MANVSLQQERKTDESPHAGGNNSDAGSHSSHPPSQALPSNVAGVSPKKSGSSQAELQPNGSNINLSLPQLCSSSSNQIESTTSSLRQPSNSPEGATSSNTVSSQGKVSTSPPRSPSPKAAKREMGKPPKPNGHLNQQERLAVSQMPCVSTTGNGPNGKTITGFLYRYTKAEVSIVCVCHGASFSPAGFVEHAGGIDVEHPLRHIRVVPFAL